VKIITNYWVKWGGSETWKAELNFLSIYGSGSSVASGYGCVCK